VRRGTKNGLLRRFANEKPKMIRVQASAQQISTALDVSAAANTSLSFFRNTLFIEGKYWKTTSGVGE